MFVIRRSELSYGCFPCVKDGSCSLLGCISRRICDVVIHKAAYFISRRACRAILLLLGSPAAAPTTINEKIEYSGYSVIHRSQYEIIYFHLIFCFVVGVFNATYL